MWFHTFMLEPKNFLYINLEIWPLSNLDKSKFFFPNSNNLLFSVDRSGQKSSSVVWMCGEKCFIINKHLNFKTHDAQTRKTKRIKPQIKTQFLCENRLFSLKIIIESVVHAKWIPKWKFNCLVGIASSNQLSLHCNLVKSWYLRVDCGLGFFFFVNV